MKVNVSAGPSLSVYSMLGHYEPPMPPAANGQGYVMSCNHQSYRCS
jgi:hypothetical protein